MVLDFKAIAEGMVEDRFEQKTGPVLGTGKLRFQPVKRKCQSKHTVDRLIRSQRDFTT